MFTFSTPILYSVGYFLNIQATIALVVGILFCGPIQQLIPKLKTGLFDEKKLSVIHMILLLILMGLSILSLASGTYNPFIYFRF